MVNDRLDKTDSIEDIVKKMSEGNPGAMQVLTQVMNKKEPIDFMNFAMQLDLMKMYGSDIWVGYKDFCEEDIDTYYELVVDADKELREYVENY